MALELDTAPLADRSASAAATAADADQSDSFDLDDLLNDADSPPFDTNEPMSPDDAASARKDTIQEAAIPAATPADKPKKGRKKKEKAASGSPTDATAGPVVTGETNSASTAAAPAFDRSPEVESLLDEIDRAKFAADSCRDVLEICKAELKDARKSYDAATDRVMDLLGKLHSVRNDQDRPLLKKAEEKQEEKAAEPVPQWADLPARMASAEPIADLPPVTADEKAELGGGWENAVKASAAPIDPNPGIPINAKPTRIQIVRMVSLAGEECQPDLMVNCGREFQCVLNDDGNVTIQAENSAGAIETVELEPEDFTVIAWDSDAATRNPETDLSWRDVRLEDLKAPAISSGILAALEAAVIDKQPVTTVGRLADWQNTTKLPLTSIKGIGEGKAAKVEDAMIAFWSRWNHGGDC